MDNCENHKKEVAGISDMKELAELIGDLHYETLSELLNALALKINTDGTRDFNSGRKLLGEILVDCSDRLSEAGDCIIAAWQVCKPFMKK